MLLLPVLNSAITYPWNGNDNYSKNLKTYRETYIKYKQATNLVSFLKGF